MSIARIVWLVSALAAVACAFTDLGGNAGLVLAVLGLISGWFLDSDHRRGVIIAAIFLSAAVGGAGALGAIPAVGEYLTAIMGSLGAVFAAASVMAIGRTLVERLMKGSASA